MQLYYVMYMILVPEKATTYRVLKLVVKCKCEEAVVDHTMRVWLGDWPNILYNIVTAKLCNTNTNLRAPCKQYVCMVLICLHGSLKICLYRVLQVDPATFIHLVLAFQSVPKS